MTALIIFIFCSAIITTMTLVEMITGNRKEGTGLIIYYLAILIQTPTPYYIFSNIDKKNPFTISLLVFVVLIIIQLVVLFISAYFQYKKIVKLRKQLNSSLIDHFDDYKSKNQ